MQNLPDLPEYQKQMGATMVTMKFMDALRTDMYPIEQAETIFGVKMQKTNPHQVKDMTIGAIVFNVWMGLFKNQMVQKQWIKKALLDGDLPAQFEKRVRELMDLAAKHKSYCGQYMPELIHRGFDKIVWDREFHNRLKLK